jgi:hypothetical protein
LILDKHLRGRYRRYVYSHNPHHELAAALQAVGVAPLQEDRMSALSIDVPPGLHWVLWALLVCLVVYKFRTERIRQRMYLLLVEWIRRRIS